MIFGIGTDIVSVDRMQRNIERYGRRFSERILGEAEQADYDASRKRAHFLAKRFAAKEAAVKAMGTGFRDGIVLRDICVRHDPLGKPDLCFAGSAEQFLREHDIGAVHLSLADEDRYAIAFVTLMRQSRTQQF